MSEGQKFVCNGAICKCNRGSLEAKLTVTSHSKDHVQDKLMATNQDKTFDPFGSCKMKRGTACWPKPLDWKDFYDKVSIVKQENKPLLEGSTIPCAIGGIISIKDTLQIQIPGTPTPHNMEEIRTAFMCLSPVMMNPAKKGKVISGKWTDLDNNKIVKAYFGETVRFHITTRNINDGEILTLQFYEDDWMNDTKVGSPKSISVSNNTAYYDLKINKDWEDMIDSLKESGEEIELYCEVTYKGKSINLADGEDELLKIYRKHKVLLVFYHGGPFGSGQIKERSNDDTGYAGVIYDTVQNYSRSKGHETIGAIIAPAATQGPGISTGFRFISKNYKPGYQIIIYGYSYGGDNAVNLAESLDTIIMKKSVDTMVIVDSSDGPLRGVSVDTSVPDNVNYTLNVYQTKASGGSSRSGKNSDDPDSSEESSSDGSSNFPGSRGFPHTGEGVDNRDATAPDVTHGNIQEKKFDLIVSTIKKRIDAYKYPE